MTPKACSLSRERTILAAMWRISEVSIVSSRHYLKLTEEEVLQGALAAVLQHQIDVIVVGFRLEDFDEERLLAVLVKFEKNFFLDEGFVELVDLGVGRLTLMICFLDIFLMATF
jgi:hypothetical protein